MQAVLLGYSGSVQTEASSNTSFIVQTSTTSLLVDTSGSPVQALLQQKVNPDLLDAVLLTHAHVDHIYALPSLLHILWMRKRTKPLEIVGSPATLKVAQDLIRLFHLDTKESLTSIIRWVEHPQRIGDIDIQTFEVFHRTTMPTQGYTLTNDKAKLSYFPDSVVQKPYPACAMASDLIIHEVGGLGKNRETLHNAGHSAADEVALLAKDLDAKQLLLVHLPPDDQLIKEIEKEAKCYFPSTMMPQDSSCFDI